MRMLITGGGGFIGRFFAKYFAQRDWEIAALVRREPLPIRLSRGSVRFVFGDIRDPDSYRGEAQQADCVIHLASCLRSPRRQDFYEVNAFGTQSLLECCRTAKTPPRVVLMSSLAAVGPSFGHPRTEADPPQPVSEYGRSKLEAERIAAAFAKEILLTIIRPPIVLGEGDLMGLQMFHSIARWRVHLHPMFRDRRYSVIHVADLADLVERVLQNGSTIDDQAYSCWYKQLHSQRSAPNTSLGLSTPKAPQNAVSSDYSARADCTKEIASASSAPPGVFFAAAEAPTYAELGRAIAEALGRRAIVVRVPAALIRIAGALGDWFAATFRRPVYLNKDKVCEILAGCWVCSSEKARCELGFQPLPLTVRLKETIESYRRDGLL